MKRIGTVSYNIYCNFTNYGSALQTWALHQAIKKVAGDMIDPVLVDYCPEILADKDPLNPFANIGFLNSWNETRNHREKIYISYDSTNKNCQAGDIEMVEFGHPKAIY